MARKPRTYDEQQRRKASDLNKLLHRSTVAVHPLLPAWWHDPKRAYRSRLQCRNYHARAQLQIESAVRLSAVPAGLLKVPYRLLHEWLATQGNAILLPLANHGTPATVAPVHLLLPCLVTISRAADCALDFNPALVASLGEVHARVVDVIGQYADERKTPSSIPPFGVARLDPDVARRTLREMVPVPKDPVQTRRAEREEWHRQHTELT